MQCFFSLRARESDYDITLSLELLLFCVDTGSGAGAAGDLVAEAVIGEVAGGLFVELAVAGGLAWMPPPVVLLLVLCTWPHPSLAELPFSDVISRPPLLFISGKVS